VAVLEPAAYGGCKDVSEAWVARVLAVSAGPAAASTRGDTLAMPEDVREAWAERVAIMTVDGGVQRGEAERLAWEGLQPPAAAR